MIDETRETVWELPDGDAAAAQALAASLRLDPLVATLLVNRGVSERDAAQRFLTPRLSEMPDPFLMKGMEAAVDRILGAFERGETVCGWGDYDGDGVEDALDVSMHPVCVGDVDVRWPRSDIAPDSMKRRSGPTRRSARTDPTVSLTSSYTLNEFNDLSGRARA